LPDLLSRATVFALSSVREAMPNALLEAMAAGVPVVATAAGGIPEAVRHEKTGLLVEPGDATAMAGAIVRLMGEAETRQRLSAAALDMIRSRHTLEAMVRGHEALFARLALERADNHREHKEAG
jgi:glycosyltransferase involved in cell wall biosynthesis